MKKIAFKIAAMFLVGILLGRGENMLFSQITVSHNPFVYVSDNKLYYQDEEFFVKACNYLVSIRIGDNSQIFVSPHSNYLTQTQLNDTQNQEEALKQLHAHFKLMKDMGFNTVRIMNASIEPKYNLDKLVIKLFRKGGNETNNPDPVRVAYEPQEGGSLYRYYEQYSNLYNGTTPEGITHLINAMQTILDVAKTYNLKVIWVMGTECRYYDGATLYRSLLQNEGHTINTQYAQALTTIASTFKNHTALLAYELYHENESFANDDLPDETFVNQATVGDIVRYVNHAVKIADPNHLTTAGLFGENTFFKLGVKPFYFTDFLNFHFYEFSSDIFNNYTKGKAINRYQYYLYKTMDYAWMIGEHGVETPVSHWSETTEGDFIVSETDQRDVVQNVMTNSSMCNSSGYALWQFANERGWQNSGALKISDTPIPVSVPVSETPVNCYFNYKSLVNPPESSVFNTFQVSDNECTFDQDLYYNIYISSLLSQEWQGHVKNNNGEPIADAIVMIHVNGGKDYYTFTGSQGQFQLSTPGILHTVKIRASKYGYDVDEVYHSVPLNLAELEINEITFSAKNEYINNLYVGAGSTLIIDKAMTYNGSAIVESNATLIIRDTVSFGENTKLVIKPGAKLILEDKGVLTAIHQRWIGVEANNTNNMPTSITATGKNSISKTIIGIRTVYDVTLNLSGTRFVNNMKDLDIYRNDATMIFRNSDFIQTDNAIDPCIASPSCDYFVKLRESGDIKFTNCHFEDNRTLDIPLNKTGIYAYRVNKLEVLPDPNVSFKKSVFKNLLYGIYAVSNSGGSIIVKNSDFKTARGIYLMDYAGLLPKIITNNTFEVLYFPKPVNKDAGNPDDEPQDEFLYMAYGVYVDNISNAYQIEGNVFRGEDGISDDRYGLIANNNGQISNSFYRNNFENLENAVQAINLNRNLASGYTNGLQVLCNKFDNTKTDIFVTTDCNYVTGGIAAKQGSLSSPAGNLFSQNAVCNYNNELVSISYFTRTNTDPYWNFREWPETISDNIIITPILGQDIPSSCPNYTITLPNHGNPELWRLDMATARSLETSITSMLGDIVDGGDTEQTVSSVLLADDNSAWLTYYELMNMSPYLSDTVLKEISSKEQGLTAAMIRDILVANPQGIKNEDLQKLLEDRSNKLPDYMIEQIKAGLTIISAKENLEIQRAEQREIYEEALKKLVAYYQCAEDSLTYAGDSIASLLNERSEAKYMYILADYYFEKSDIKSALSVLNRISSVCVLSKNEAIENEDLSSFYKFYDYLKEYYKNDMTNINETHIKQLQEYELKGGRAGAKARALLMLNNATTYKEAVYKPEPILANRTAKAGRTSIADPSFSVYPNPAKEYIYVDYKLAEQNGTLQFTIADITGKILIQKQLYGLQDIIIVKTADLPEGSYNCSLYNGNKLMFNSKLIIKK